MRDKTEMTGNATIQGMLHSTGYAGPVIGGRSRSCGAVSPQARHGYEWSARDYARFPNMPISLNYAG